MRPLHVLLSVLLLAGALLSGAETAPAAGPSPDLGPAVRLADLDPGVVNDGSQRYSTQAVTAAGHLFLLAETDAFGRELYTSDGTPDSTRLVADICPGPCMSLTGPLIVAGTRVFFESWDGLDTEIWSLDAAVTPFAPRKLDLRPGPDSSSIALMTPLGSRLALAAGATSEDPYNPLGDMELVITDGTAGGTVRYDLNPGPGSSSPGGLTVAGGRLFFNADDGTHGRELWTTTGGPPTMLELNPTGAAFTWHMGMVAAGPRVFFTATDGVRGLEPGTSDGVSATLFDLNPAGDSIATSGSSLVAAADRAFFLAASAATGVELATSDGLSAGVRIFDLNPGSASSNPEGLATLNGQLYFIASNPTVGTELGISDGVTAELIDLTPEGPSFSRIRGPEPGYRPDFTQVGKGVCFISNPDAQSASWVACASGRAARRIAQTASLGLESGGGKAFFVTAGAAGHEPGFTDGATLQTLDLAPGEASSNPFWLGAAGGRALLGATTPGRGVEPLASDGSVAGTTLFDLEPGPWELVPECELLLLWRSARLLPRQNQRGGWRAGRPGGRQGQSARREPRAGELEHLLCGRPARAIRHALLGRRPGPRLGALGERRQPGRDAARA